MNIEKPSPQLNLPITKKEKKAYRSECVKRPKIDAPTNTNSYLCENNDSPSVSIKMYNGHNRKKKSSRRVTFGHFFSNLKYPRWVSNGPIKKMIFRAQMLH